MSSQNYNSNNPRASKYAGDDINVHLVGYSMPEPQAVPFGTAVDGVYFDGYPQIIKIPLTEPTYKVKVEKDVMVPLRDGVRVAVDIYHTDVDGGKFPTILCWGEWGKDAQDIVAWMADYPQKYWEAPFWNGSIEGCNFNYTVPRGYIHIIADPRGIGESEGINLGDETFHSRKDINDTVDWIAKQPWSDGKVVMMGPSSYSRAQLQASQEPSPHLIAIRPDEGPDSATENFTGIFDPLLYNVHCGVHAYDQLQVASHNQPQPRLQPKVFSEYSKEELKNVVQELVDDPDIKYNMKFYPEVRYPASSPSLVDDLLYLKHPVPIDNGLQNISVPMYLGACWNNRLYAWSTFEAFRKANLPPEQKSLSFIRPCSPLVPMHNITMKRKRKFLRHIA